MTDLTPHLGSTHKMQVRVERAHTVPALPIGSAAAKAMPEVLATPVLVAFVEQTCIEHIAALLPDAPMSLGVSVQLDHTAATPVGFTVTIATELVEVRGRTAVFRFTARDQIDEIGSGRHARVLVERERLLQRIAAKAARRPA